MYDTITLTFPTMLLVVAFTVVGFIVLLYSLGRFIGLVSTPVLVAPTSVYTAGASLQGYMQTYRDLIVESQTYRVRIGSVSTIPRSCAYCGCHDATDRSTCSHCGAPYPERRVA